MSKKIVFSLFAAFFSFFPNIGLARENVADWYIKDFDSQIVVNKDSSLDITETIVADAGRGVDKHGIFRILPTKLNVEGKEIATPVELVGITDNSGQAYEYQAIKDRENGTVTWKIGSADKTVQGVNTYVIKYKVQNAIRFDNNDFDELYWNLSGNFWDLQIDKFHATIKIPAEINQKNSAVEYYAGASGSKEKNLATYRWSSVNVLEFESAKTLLERQGITVSVTFPKNIISPYKPNFWQKYGELFYLLIPIFIAALLYAVWKKYGDDPSFDKTVIAEYEIPKNLSPIEAGVLMKSGGFDNSFITSEIIFFATKGIITIKEIDKKILMFNKKDYELVRTDNVEAESKLNEPQRMILDSIFVKQKTRLLSELKNFFYKQIPEIKKATNKLLDNKSLFESKGFNIGNIIKGLSVASIYGVFYAYNYSNILALSIAISSIIAFIFSIIMPKRTLIGAETNWKLKGFKLFMETVDKDRAVFYEKENIFEKCLPYAIMFGMTKQWIKKMEEVYGMEYLNSHAPVWYAGNFTSFDANGFVSEIDSISSAISKNTATPSGSGGGGMSGGGGGGGGGGGW